MRNEIIALTLVALGLLLMASAARADELLTTFYGGVDGYCGGITASGEVYDCGGYTAATNVYALGTMLEVCYEGCVTVRVNDRCGGCGLDLSMAAAADIGIDLYGPAVTEITVL